MFDGIKIYYNDKSLVRRLHKNTKWDFTQHANIATGDILSHTAEYKGWKFKTFPSGRIEIKGSLHKYYNEGLHNYDDYTISNLSETIARMETEFGIVANRASIHNLEYGVNISPPFDPTTLIDSLISFKFKPFNMMQVKHAGHGKECFHFGQYGLKIYDKGLQNKIPKNILRLEKKVLVMCSLKFGDIFLSDLTNPLLWKHCKKELIVSVGHILINETLSNEQLTINEQRIYSSILNESIRVNLNRDQRKRYKKGFNMIIGKYGSCNYREILLNLLSGKCDDLLESKVHTF